MLTVETIGRIRREHFLKGKTIKEIARDLRVSRNTVRRVLRSGATSFEYERQVQPRPKLGRWTGGTRRVVDEQCGEGCSRAADADPGLRGTTRARLRRRLRCTECAISARGRAGGL